MKVRYKIYKIFLSYEKEEKWLNDMAAKGLNFIDYSFPFRYLFEEGTPGEYIYRLELLNEPSSNGESKAYIKFMEEAGVECVFTYMRWVCFRKRTSEGNFDLYSDYDSKIKHHKRIATFMGIIGSSNLMIAASNVIIGLIVGHERGFYLNLYFSVINWIIAFCLIPMFFSHIKKIHRMKKEKQLYE